MSLRVRPVQLVLRKTALLLALICLWMSSGATLHHTDDLSVLRAFPPGCSADRHATPAPVFPACAAHEWMDAWQTSPAPPPAVTRAPLSAVRFSVAISPALHLRCFDYTSLRAPPIFFS